MRKVKLSLVLSDPQVPVEQGEVGRLLSQVEQQSQAVRSQLDPHGGGQHVLNPEETESFNIKGAVVQLQFSDPVHHPRA